MSDPSGQYEFYRKLSRLQTLLAIRDAQLMANPKPYLEDMARRCNELLKVLDDVYWALSPDVVFAYWDEKADKSLIPAPDSIQGEAYIRCNKALEILREWRNQ